MFIEVKKFIDDAFQNSLYGSGSIKHFERTVDWLKMLKPDADEPMLIAAYAHDIERAFRKTDSTETFKSIAFNDETFLAHHQSRGADIVRVFLRDNGYPDEATQRVYRMIYHHEVGGDEESNFIKDADSISYLENNTQLHIGLTSSLGVEKIKEKVDWMFERITSPRAKALAQPFYNSAIAKLGGN